MMYQSHPPPGHPLMQKAEWELGSGAPRPANGPPRRAPPLPDQSHASSSAHGRGGRPEGCLRTPPPIAPADALEGKTTQVHVPPAPTTPARATKPAARPGGGRETASSSEVALSNAADWAVSEAVNVDEIFSQTVARPPATDPSWPSSLHMMWIELGHDESVHEVHKTMQTAQFCRSELEQNAIRTKSYWPAVVIRLNGWPGVCLEYRMFRPRPAKLSRLQIGDQYFDCPILGAEECLPATTAPQ